MSELPPSKERFEIVGLTRAEAERCMEVLAVGSMLWERGHCYVTNELQARPERCKCAQCSADEPPAGLWEVFFFPKLHERGVFNEQHGYRLRVTGPFHSEDERRTYCEKLAAQLNGASPPQRASGDDNANTAADRLVRARTAGKTSASDGDLACPVVSASSRVALQAIRDVTDVGALYENKHLFDVASEGLRCSDPPPPAVHSELELAAAHYVRVSQNPNLSRYITENGRHPGSGGPWAELVSAVDAAIAAQTKGGEQA